MAAALALFAALATAGACKPKGLENPPALSETSATSRLMPEADRLIRALEEREIASLHAWMTPALRSQVAVSTLTVASDRLRGHFGPPLGILEERVHREGDLRWYSGLVLHGLSRERGGDGQLRLVLYQFALDPGDLLDRLLVREHLYLEELDHPAEAYLTITRFHFPSTGEWMTGHGGRRRATNYHHGSRTQRYAYDFVVQRNGVGRRGRGKRNADYLCYGLPVLAPAPGVVLQAIDGIPENTPGKRGEGGGNGVVLDHGFGETSALWHFIPGTVTVRVGDRVKLGQVLGKVGNSGSSTAPHIHFHAAHGPIGGRREALPAPFVDVYLDGIWHERAMPVRGQRVRGRMPERRISEQAHRPEILIAGL